MKITRYDQHARRVEPRLFGELRRKQQIFPRVRRLRLLKDLRCVGAVREQVLRHDRRFRVRFVRALPAGDDHGPVRVCLQEFERLVQTLFERQRRSVALDLRAKHDNEIRCFVWCHGAVLSLHADIAHRAEDDRHRDSRQRDEDPAPDPRRVLFSEDPQRQQHRRQKQQTHARHADVQRQRQTDRAEQRDRRDQPYRDHVASSSSQERASHCSIICASVSSACCFSSISRASS